MSIRRPYSNITLTSLLDVVFLTLFMILFVVRRDYQSANAELEQREQSAAVTATSALAAASATVVSAQEAESQARATIEAALVALERANDAATAETQSGSATATSLSAALNAQQQRIATMEAEMAVERTAAQTTATALAAAAAQQEQAAATSDARLATLQATATAAARQAAAQVTARATPLAELAAARVTLTAIAAQSEQQRNASATAVATAQAGIVEVQRTAEAGLLSAQAAEATAQAMYDLAWDRYQEAEQILAAETAEPGITIAKARWVDKYATLYLIRLSPQVAGVSTIEVFRGNTFLSSREIRTQTQIRDVLSALDRSDVDDTLVIVTFSPASSDNHREWILNYLDAYNFKVQRMQEEAGR